VDITPNLTAAVLAQLVSYEEIAQLLGVQKATVWRWKSTDALPEPVGQISGQWLWTREAIVEWAHSTGRTIIY
jgi:predicted DNA-binding transcriptional regulator AlpA